MHEYGIIDAFLFKQFNAIGIDSEVFCGLTDEERIKSEQEHVRQLVFFRSLTVAADGFLARGKENRTCGSTHVLEPASFFNFTSNRRSNIQGKHVMHVYGVVQFIVQEAMLLNRDLLPVRTSARENNGREVIMDNFPNGWPQKTQERDVGGIYQHFILVNFEVVNTCSNFLGFIA